MVHLDENNLIHRDLRTRNCLVGKNLVVKVNDFGLTRHVTNPRMNTEMLVSYRIEAPETLRIFRKRFSTKSDVYAFGMIINFHFKIILNKKFILKQKENFSFFFFF